MRIYFDTEFTGLHQNTTLISVGAVSDDGQEFYAELTDYDRAQVDDWLRDNVIAHLRFTADAERDGPRGVLIDGYVGDRPWVAERLRSWLSQWERVEMWSDCYAYDWVLFCELFGGAFGVPKNVHYIPIDLSTALLMRGHDPDVSREAFAGMDGDKHNALHDARVIRACVQRLGDI
jgi:3' exoribonuclease, RNase T-like